MIIDRTHKKWGITTAFLSLVIFGLYLIARTQAPVGTFGGTPVGLGFGICALLIMLMASLLGARKKIPAWRIGRATTWMKAHIWLSILLVPLVLFHSGLRWGGHFTFLIWILLITVTVSGLVGVLIQQILPRLMTDSVPLETIYDQIGFITEQLRYECDQLVSGVCGALGLEIPVPEGIKAIKIKEGPSSEGSEIIKNFYLNSLRPSLDPKGHLNSLFASTQKIQTVFSQLRISLPPALHPVLERLSEITEERRQFEKQKKLHWILHGWLLVHVPVSAVLMLLVIVHAGMALFY